MRVQHVILAALVMSGATPAFAQNQTSPVSNAVAAPAEKAEPAKPKVAVASEKICKRLPQGKVCMTAEKWKQYQEMY